MCATVFLPLLFCDLVSAGSLCSNPSCTVLAALWPSRPRGRECNEFGRARTARLSTNVAFLFRSSFSCVASSHCPSYSLLFRCRNLRSCVAGSPLFFVGEKNGEVCRFRPDSFGGGLFSVGGSALLAARWTGKLIGCALAGIAEVARTDAGGSPAAQLGGRRFGGKEWLGCRLAHGVPRMITRLFAQSWEVANCLSLSGETLLIASDRDSALQPLEKASLISTVLVYWIHRLIGFREQRPSVFSASALSLP